jgi:hypothetical protein
MDPMLLFDERVFPSWKTRACISEASESGFSAMMIVKVDGAENDRSRVAVSIGRAPTNTPFTRNRRRKCENWPILNCLR